MRPAGASIALRGALLATAAVLLTACGGGGAAGTPGAAPGDELVIVTATPGTPPPGPTVDRRYRVAPGDTLSAIADRFDVTEEALRRANGIDDPNDLLVGQDLVIPTPEP